MKNTGFDKALFKSAVTFNVKNMFRRTIDEASVFEGTSPCQALRD